VQRFLSIGESYSYNELVGLNEPHPFSGKTKVVSKNLNTSSPKISVVVPVYNKSSIICDVLDSICVNIESTFELIILDDCSDDQSLMTIKNFCENRNIQYILLSNEVPLYETACDNIGFAISRGEYLLEIQSDIYIKDKGFDLRMIDAANLQCISSVSGRCVHSWIDLYSSRWKYFKLLISPFFLIKLITNKSGEGLIGAKVFDNNISMREAPDEIYTGDTNNRGPWMITMKNYKKIGPLDSDHFFLGGDDHDFNYRAKKEGLVAAYVPLCMVTNPSDGSTRQKRVGRNKEIYNLINKK